jgi:membrane-associated phospholipid phosphatase
VRTGLQSHWKLKAALTLGLNLLFWLGYGFLARHTFFPVWTPPQTWLDAAIPFQPEPWGWIYLSQFTFTSALPWWLDTRRALRRYVVGVGVLCGVSFCFFLLLPVASPRPVEFATTTAMTWIAGYDGAFNAFPSLHAGFLVYLGALAARMFGRRLPAAWWALMSLWGVAILYATIATRQHYAVDLVAGGALGWLADRVAWGGQFSRNASRTIARSNGLASQAGCK